MRIAVVAASWGDPWREADVVASRVTGALATEAEVELLYAGDSRDVTTTEARYPVRAFPTVRVPAERRLALRSLVPGSDVPWGLESCACLEGASGGDLPRPAQEELAASFGGHSPELYAHLRASRYDVVVFAGFHHAASALGVSHVPARTRVVVLPLARRDGLLRLGLYDRLFERADRVLVVTETERRLVATRIGDGEERVRNVGFVLRVHPLASTTMPGWDESHQLVTVCRDWTAPFPLKRLLAVAERVRAAFPDVRICLIGRGWERLPRYGPAVVRGSQSRTDLWRWMSRSVATLDPEPRRLLARDVLEGMLFGVPALVAAEGGASREHAEEGRGGLWFRNGTELLESIRALSDDDARAALGEQGRSYAEERFGDPERFVLEVTAELR